MMIGLVLVTRGITCSAASVCDSWRSRSDIRRAPTTLVRVLCEGKASLRAGDSQNSSSYVIWCKRCCSQEGLCRVEEWGGFKLS